MSENNFTEEKQIFAMAKDPIYIGTGGYNIGRVDNTIVRDPITKIPKIPGSSLAGTWRYYVTLELISKIKNYQPDFEKIKNRTENSLVEKINNENWKTGFSLNGWLAYFGNKIAKITCAGQDNVPTGELDSPDATDKNGNTGHCGHCIVCKAFGYAKKDKSWQGMLFFSDLNILFFPVYTRFGVRWISSPSLLKKISIDVTVSDKKIKTKAGNEKTLNLGWLNLEVEGSYAIDENKIPQEIKDKVDINNIIIVPDSLISQIINSNLEVRTSVSIDPITGASKEGALFTGEAIPRGTVFYGNLRIFDKKKLGDNNLPSKWDILEALKDSKEYYKTLGIGGMTTRGFGRMEIVLKDKQNNIEKNGATKDDEGKPAEDSSKENN